MKRALIIALFTFTTLASFGISTCEAGGTEGSRQKIQWHLDYFIDAAVFTQAGYQFIGGPWSREIDPSQARINNRLNRILQTTTEDGPGSILYPEYIFFCPESGSWWPCLPPRALFFTQNLVSFAQKVILGGLA